MSQCASSTTDAVICLLLLYHTKKGLRSIIEHKKFKKDTKPKESL